MTETMVLELGRNAVMMTLMLALPMLIVSLAVGLVIGIIQAATQIHEPTVNFVPKVLAMVGVLALLGPWMLQNMVRYTAELLSSLPNLTR
jgi:flagellar biosynthesis protein FliQ